MRGSTRKSQFVPRGSWRTALSAMRVVGGGGLARGTIAISAVCLSVHCGTSRSVGIDMDSGASFDSGAPSGSSSGSGSGSTSGSGSGSTSGSSSGSGTDAGVDADAALDGGGAEAGCRSSSDCPPYAQGGCGTGAYCQGPQEGPCIGVVLDVHRCSTDSDCADAAAPGGFRPTVCRESNVVPTEPKGCWAPCTSDGYCPAQDQCEIDSGHCTPRSCPACPPYFDCNGGTCSVRSCRTDGDCPQGDCVNGTCQSRLGVCTPDCC